MAAYNKIQSILKKHDIQLIVVFTTSEDFYTNHFTPSLGFDVESIGTSVIDETKQTHKAAGLKSSVWASLVLPFRYHLKTFGIKAVWEALRVSLKNAKKGSGSSWKQVGTFCFENAVDETTGKLSPKPTLAWREDYPGDWMPIRDILQQGANIHDEDKKLNMSWPDILDYVIQCRKENERKLNEGEEKKEEGEEVVCGEDICDLKQIRKGLEHSPNQ